MLMRFPRGFVSNELCNCCLIREKFGAVVIEVAMYLCGVMHNGLARNYSMLISKLFDAGMGQVCFVGKTYALLL